MAATQKSSTKKRVLTKTKSGSYVPDFMKVDPEAETDATSMVPSMMDNKKKDQSSNKETKLKPEPSHEEASASVTDEKEQSFSLAVPDSKTASITEEKYGEKSPKKEGKHYKPKSFEELVDKSGEDYVVPLELSNKRIYYFTLFTLIIICSIAAVVFYFRTKQPINGTQDVVVEVTEEQVAPTTPELSTPDSDIKQVSQLSRNEIELEVLNGSNVAGAAGEAAQIFEDLGYKIIKVANAQETKANEIYMNPLLSDKLDTLLEDVNKELGIEKVTGELTDSSASARIILGSD
jgi:hypothetical protein